ncbi:hypothetical protein DY000_02061326 [Brassica cretica]|uniref:Pectinesterase inhibitor domain-containing protein n=1 Tax=Brassica cretica TaxID=69181 RepID=A0ABQ7AZF4_BRACR|nr:hypothetical protein DY000_02061326 [Brassica cretica]
MFSCISTVLLILIFIIALTLALPVYKARNSRIRIQCAALQGMASSIEVQLSFTLKSARSIVRKDCVGNKSKDPMKSQAARNLQEAISDCEITLDFSSMKVQNKECEMSTKL